MDKKNYAEMSNIELKQYLITLENSFAAQKAKITEMCEVLGDIENEYVKAKSELDIRKTIF